MKNLNKIKITKLFYNNIYKKTYNNRNNFNKNKIYFNNN